MRTARFTGPGASDWTLDLPTSRRERVRGLRGRTLAPRSGMLFPRCRSVHTFGMTMAISVVMLDGHLSVRAVRVMPPRRVLVPRLDTKHIVECAPDQRIVIGDRFVPRDGSEI